jgi:hypothetical protein
MRQDNLIALISLVAVLGLVTVVAVDIIMTTQEAEAKGCRTSTAFNASKGRCLRT